MARSNSDETSGAGTPLALVLVVVALLLLVVFQTIELIHNRSTLSELRSGQEATVQEATKSRDQLNVLAGKTAQLAADGDANARAIVEDLRRQGVTLSSPKQ